MLDIDSDIADNFIKELDALLEKYDGMILNVTLIGCLEVVKSQLVMDSLIEARIDGEDEED